MNVLYRQKINNRKEKEKKNREEEISDLKIVVFMLSCGALERSDKPHVQSCVESFVSKNQKKILAMWLSSRGKSCRITEAMNEVSMRWKRNFGICVWDRSKFSSFEIM